MPELQQLPFQVNRDAQGDVDFAYTDDHVHAATVDWLSHGEIEVHCRCGARWRIAHSKANDAEVLATFTAHLAFAARQFKRAE